MNRTSPFARAFAMMNAITAVMQQFANNYAGRTAALGEIGPYKSRGHGGKRPHRSVGTKAYQRAALKARNRRHSK